MTTEQEPTDALTERIAHTLRQHRLSEPSGGTGSLSSCDCSCGHESNTGGDREFAWILALRHQADIIAAEVRSAQHEAWDEGLEAGRDRWADSREFGDPPVNPYHATETGGRA